MTEICLEFDLVVEREGFLTTRIVTNGRFAAALERRDLLCGQKWGERGMNVGAGAFRRRAV